MKQENNEIGAKNNESTISDMQLRRKIGHIIGFSIDPEISIDEIVKMLKDNGKESIVHEIEKTIKARNQVKTKEDYINYFRKDLSQI